MADLDPREEFRRLFERTGRSLLAQAYLVTGDRQESQDLVQEAFLRAWNDWRPLLDPRQSAGVASTSPLQPRREPLAEPRGEAISRAPLSFRRRCSGTRRRAPRCHEGASVLADETARGPRASCDRRPDDGRSGSGDGSKRGDRPRLGVPGAGNHGALAGARRRAAQEQRRGR